MSAAQEINQNENSGDFLVHNLEVGEKNSDNVSIQKVSVPIRVPDLEPGKMYKIRKWHQFEWKSWRVAGKIGTEVFIEPGHLVLPHRFREIADYIKLKQAKNIYMLYKGRRGKRNEYIIHFYDEENLIELKSN